MPRPGCLTKPRRLLVMNANDPLAMVYLGWVNQQRGEETQAQQAFARAAALPPDYVFPNQLECVLALTCAMQLNPFDGRAPYYLGNFWYAHRRYAEAIACWETAATLDAGFPPFFATWGWLYYNNRAMPAGHAKPMKPLTGWTRGTHAFFLELDA